MWLLPMSGWTAPSWPEATGASAGNVDEHAYAGEVAEMKIHPATRTTETTTTAPMRALRCRSRKFGWSYRRRATSRRPARRVPLGDVEVGRVGRVVRVPGVALAAAAAAPAP